MAGKTLQAYALSRAAKILGGAEALAKFLGISQTWLKLYLEDREMMPGALFLKIVDLLTDAEIEKIAGKRPALGNGSQARPKKNGSGNGNKRRNG